MKRLLISVILAVALLVIPVSGALAAETQDVTVTAVPSYVSIATITSATGTAFDFAGVAAGVDEQTSNGYFTIPNDSGVGIDITIQCTTAWTSWTYGAAAEDTAQLLVSSANGGAGGSTGAGNFDITILTASATLLMDAVGTGTNPTFELQLDAPSSFTHSDSQECTIRLSAAAS